MVEISKSSQRFAKQHQLMICLISFTYGKMFPGLQGQLAVVHGAARVLGSNNMHGCIEGGAVSSSSPSLHFAEQPNSS